MKNVSIVLLAALTLASCQSNTSGTVTYTVEQPESVCIDTNILNQMGVQHRRFIVADKETWLLKYTKPVEASNIYTLSYFYSWPPIGEDCSDDSKWFQVDSIQAQMTNSNTQTLGIQEFTAGTSMDKLNQPDSRLIDINFDGYPDIEMGLNEVSGNANEMRRYFVYNPEKEAFENGMDLVNFRRDSEAKFLYTHWSGGQAGRIGAREWFSFVGYDSIRLEKAINSDFDRELEAYVVETIELNAEGNYETRVDTVTFDEWN